MRKFPRLLAIIYLLLYNLHDCNFKFGLVLIYRLNVYRKKASSILLTKIKFSFSFEKHLYFLKWFLCWKSKNYCQQFLTNFFSETYLSPIISYWGNIFPLYLMWGVFSLVCIVWVFFFFLFFFFFFSFIGIFLDRH